MIVTFEDIKNVRPIASNIDETKFAPYIGEAETLHVIPLIGAKLYKELSTTPAGNEMLLNGGYYDGDNQHCVGLTTAIAYLAYARFIINSNISVTAIGAMLRSGEHSTPTSTSSIAMASKDAERVGLEYLRQCSDYLNWKNKGAAVTEVKRKRRTIIKVIG